MKSSALVGGYKTRLACASMFCQTAREQPKCCQSSRWGEERTCHCVIEPRQTQTRQNAAPANRPWQ